MDLEQFRPLMTATQDQDEFAATSETAVALAILEGLESQYGTLAALAACPELAPEVQIEILAGDFLVDWIDDETTEILHTDPLPGGTVSPALTPPTFERHLAVGRTAGSIGGGKNEVNKLSGGGLS